VTDLACLAGQLFGTSRDPDTRNTGQNLKQACGAGDQIRNGMVKDLTGQGAASPPPAESLATDPGAEFAKAMQQEIQKREAQKKAEALAKGSPPPAPQPDPPDEFAKAKEGPLFRPY
jgi:hypothetical protein